MIANGGQLACQIAGRSVSLVRIFRQATLDRILRLENVATAFVVRDAKKISSKRILLVDDVRTTGATLRACASALRNAGAARVYDIALAVADN